MTHSRPIEVHDNDRVKSLVVSPQPVELPAFLMWIFTLAVEQPIGFPVLIGLVSGALADSVEAVLIGVVIGFLMRWVVTSFRPGNGLP